MRLATPSRPLRATRPWTERRRRRGGVLAAFLVAACGGTTPPPGEVRTEPLMTAALAGATVIVPPVTMVVIEPATPGADGLTAATRNGWADSLVAEALGTRAPEVRWVLPAELRRVARRAPGVAADPDQMGQAVLRQPGFTSVPDPLRSHLRTLMGLAGGGRHAFVPAAILLQPAAGGVQAHLIAVLADGRSGAILWRTEASGEGASPSAALSTALARILPILQP